MLGPMNTVRLKRLRREALFSPIPMDEDLLLAADVSRNHNFLRGATGQLCQRHVELLSKILSEHFRKPADQVRILDWGAGSGHMSHLLRKRGFDVTSCDVLDLNEQRQDSAFSKEYTLSANKPFSTVPLMDEVKLPFIDASFDCVISVGVLEHVADDVASLAEIRRIIRLDGIFFITFLPYIFSWTQRFAHLRGNFYHDRLYSMNKLRYMSQRAGFSVADISLGQLFPKNRAPNLKFVEAIDRFFTEYTPVRFISTNIEAVLIAQ
jgi:SAM-dependent methyltransferase